MTSTRKKYKYMVDNKLRGAYGEIDPNKKVIRINKKRHKSPSAKRISPKKDGNEHLGKTILHEELHRRYPKKTEKQVRKAEKGWEKLTPSQKKSYYNKLRK